MGWRVFDVEAIAGHLLASQRAAAERSTDIERVISDPRLTALLLRSPQGAALARLPVMKQQARRRNDEHYHVEFAVPCRPLAPLSR